MWTVSNRAKSQAWLLIVFNNQAMFGLGEGEKTGLARAHSSPQRRAGSLLPWAIFMHKCCVRSQRPLCRQSHSSCWFMKNTGCLHSNLCEHDCGNRRPVL
jgi:hypothetical protein